MDPVLDTLSVVSKTISSNTIDFQQLQNFTSSTLLRFEALKDYTSSGYINILESIQQLQLKPSMLRVSRSSRSEKLTYLRGIFDDKVVPFIDAMIGSIKSRFDQNTFSLLQCFSILHMENVTEDKDYSEKEIVALQQHYPEDFDSKLRFEWKTFRKYLLTQKSTGKKIFQRENMHRTCSEWKTERRLSTAVGCSGDLPYCSDEHSDHRTRVFCYEQNPEQVEESINNCASWCIDENIGGGFGGSEWIAG